MKTIADHKRGDTWKGMTMRITDPILVGDVITNVPRDLTGYEALASFKVSPSSAVAFDFKTSDDTITFKDNDPTLGILVFMPRNMDVPANRYIFDVQLTYNGDVVQTIYGLQNDFSWTITQDIS